MQRVFGGRAVPRQMPEVSELNVESAISDCQARLEEFATQVQIAEQDMATLFQEFRQKNKARYRDATTAQAAFKKTPDYARLHLARQRGKNVVANETARLTTLMRMEDIANGAKTTELIIQEMRRTSQLARTVLEARNADRLHETIGEFREMQDELASLQQQISDVNLGGAGGDTEDAFDFAQEDEGTDPSVLEAAPAAPKGFVQKQQAKQKVVERVEELDAL